jgi:hypothetical protein
LNTPTQKRNRRDTRSIQPPQVVVLNNGGEFEEDVELLQNTAVRLLGPNGRMLWPNTPNTVHNCVIFTPRLGKIWYGDLDMIAQSDALAALKVHLKGMAFAQS